MHMTRSCYWRGPPGLHDRLQLAYTTHPDVLGPQWDKRYKAKLEPSTRLGGKHRCVMTSRADSWGLVATHGLYLVGTTKYEGNTNEEVHRYMVVVLEYDAIRQPTYVEMETN